MRSFVLKDAGDNVEHISNSFLGKKEISVIEHGKENVSLCKFDDKELNKLDVDENLTRKLTNGELIVYHLNSKEHIPIDELKNNYRITKNGELILIDDQNDKKALNGLEKDNRISVAYSFENPKETEYYDDNGELYRKGNDLCPFTEYELNGYKYKTDEYGRIISAEGTLHLKDRDGRLKIKDSIEDIGKGDQKENDDRGHLIGDQFDGTNGLENMIPQDADINRNDFKNFENELAKEVREGKTVTVKIEIIYEGESRRPTLIIVTYSIDGEESVRVFPNEKET